MEERESLKQDGLIPRATPTISPSSSLTSTDSTVSNCSDFSVDANLSRRGDHEESSTDGSLEDSELSVNGHNQKTTIPNHLKSKISDGCTERDAEALGTETRDSVVENAETDISDPVSDEMDAQIWVPPGPEDQDDDVEGSVRNFDYDDDDEEFGDGTKWGKPACLSSFGEEGSATHRFKEEKQKAMDEVMNGKFKALVGHLLKSVGVSVSREDGDSWADIVTALSWEAASFVKPNAIDGKAMDLDGYVKVKCIATGIRSQSEVIRGLVFKKHAAHKHMPTKYKNPRLLLIQGALGMSSNELSSFQAMQQEKDSNLKSITETIETCHPNVILVEKTVSRDIQESILAKGMTLVLDMKLHRLERVARCTGVSILSSDTLVGQKLKQCDSFHFEKLVEEHDAPLEGGKRPSKTLMFLEGCPTRLGCTILLKGAQSDELKRIKCVVQCAVVMAYHLILETSFLLDQKAMFSTVPSNGVANLVVSDDSNLSCPEEAIVKTDSPCTVDIPISNVFHAEESDNLNADIDGKSPLSYEPYNPVVLSGFSSLSASLKKVIGENFPHLSSTSGQLMSTYFGLEGKESDHPDPTTIHVVASPKVFDHYEVEARFSSDEEKALDSERSNSPVDFETITLETKNYGGSDTGETQSKDDVSTVLESESILVLMSRRNASRGTICEQSHFSHIKFYRHFDVPLGKFLRDNLLNQRTQCTECGEPPEGHFYYYAHHKKQLTIQVKRLSMDTRLPGEAEGKLWMWSRCGKCKSLNGDSKSTKRVLISTAARDLSFGKFLELGFSNFSSVKRLSSCGHSLHKDFLYFFGLGPMVAMFKYSSIATYSVSVPPQKLEFCDSIKPGLLKEETMKVYMKGMLLFSEVEKSLQTMEARFANTTLNHCGALKKFSDIQEMLKQEISWFEKNIENKVVKNGNSNEAVYKFLYLNQLLLELMLESCIWERRLHSLLSSDSTVIETKATDAEVEGKTYLNGENDRSEENLESGEEDCVNGVDGKDDLGISMEENECPTEEIVIDGSVQGSKEDESIVGIVNVNGLSGEGILVRPNCSSDNCDSEICEGDRTIPIAGDIEVGVLSLNQSSLSSPVSQFLGNKESKEDWIWTPFPEIRTDYMKDLLTGFVPKFEPISNNFSERLSTAHKLLTEEGAKLYIPLGIDDYVVSDYEGELSSVISCALALLRDLPTPSEDLDENTQKERGLAVKSNESSRSLTRISSLTSPHWSSFGSLDASVLHSSHSFSMAESHLSSFDGLSLLDSLVSLGALHPEVSMGVEKLAGKGKYSVTTLYAAQFRDLRNRCCPSELDYIASLSRCRNWDAKGGKSKSFFAKTLDDRFVIKEIKRTEIESFTKFASEYFKYMNECFDKGNQTCLAKILGIYQVTIRQPKSGKEVKHDLMVMENLTFGRNVTKQYDLKGALHARFSTSVDGSGDVLLDQNFVNDMNTSPMYVRRRSKRLLQRAVWNDTTFLNSINVMDYSLLVGVDPRRHELACGIIDYLRQYTWDKQLETWVKSSLVVPKNQLPTIISPIDYKRRFRKFMSKYFLSVPDHWCSRRSSNPCKLCGTGDDHSPDTNSLKQVE